MSNGPLGQPPQPSYNQFNNQYPPPAQPPRPTPPMQNPVRKNVAKISNVSIIHCL